MYYREAAPPAELKPYVFSFWEFLVPSDTPLSITHEIFPDGCVSIMIYQNRHLGFSRAMFNGLHLSSLAKTINPGDQLWGMRLSPAAATAVMSTDKSALWGTGLFEAAKFPGIAPDLEARLDRAESFENAIAILAECINVKSIKRDLLVEAAVEMIEKSKGEMRVSDIAESLNICTRQLLRRFKERSGLTPKQFARFRRIRAAAIAMTENQTSWAEAAAEFGFSDQSHLSHEFTSVTRRTPKNFAEKISRISHGVLLSE